jgi:hypothetical protein
MNVEPNIMGSSRNILGYPKRLKSFHLNLMSQAQRFPTIVIELNVVMDNQKCDKRVL